METIVIDGSRMSDRQTAHQHLAERLSFPGYYGRNLDALYDLLAEREGPVRLLVRRRAALLDGLGSSGEGAALQGQLPDQGAAPPPMETEELGDIQAAGRDLSGVALDGKTGALTLRGEAEVILRGLGREAQAIRLTSPGAAILQQVEARLLSAEGPQTLSLIHI